MESLFPLEDSRSSILLIGILVGLIVSSTMLSGLWMKLANYLCGGTPVGMPRAILAALVSLVFGSGAAVLASSLQPEDPPYVSAIYGNIAAVFGISLVMFQNPLRAFLTYIVCSVLQVASAIGFAIACFLLVTAMVPADQLQQMGAQMEEIARQSNLESAEKVQSWLVSNKTLTETEVTTVKESGVTLSRESSATPAKERKQLPLGHGVQPNPFAQ